MISNYDIEFAENLKDKLIEKKLLHNFSNIVITSVMLGKVKLGFPLNDIERDMLELRQDYDYQGKPESDYYEQKIKVYLNIAESELYTVKEKKEAFEKICAEYNEMESQNLSYYLSDRDFKNEKLRLSKLAKKYRKKLNITFDEKTEIKAKPKMSEEKFVKEFEKAKTKKKIGRLFLDLHNYKNEIIILKPELWEILINKIFEMFGNINLFIDYLKEKHFPHFGYWTSNSEYLHLGLATALRNNNTRQETLKYLFKNSGHGGFVNVMKAYEVNSDRKMCLLLFERYLKLCDFIVN